MSTRVGVAQNPNVLFEVPETGQLSVFRKANKGLITLRLFGMVIAVF
jgi:hypothetical protein